MKIIENDNKVHIILENNDKLEVSLLYNNKEKIMIKCLNSIIHIEELTVSEIKERSMEQNEINKMKKFLDK